jgi:putative acetyltransferase
VPRSIEPVPPDAPEVLAVVARHRAFAEATTPPEGVFALDASGLASPDVTVFALREDGELLGIAALRQLGPAHGEVKSMHTLEAARGRGVGRALLEHVLAVARRRGYARLSLETGAMDAFAPARALYAAAGFVPCGPFGGYPDGPTSAFFTLELR